MKKNKAESFIPNDDRCWVLKNGGGVGYIPTNPSIKNKKEFLIDSKNINIPFEVTTYLEGHHKTAYDMVIEKFVRAGISNRGAAILIAQKIAKALQSELASILKANGIKSKVIDIIPGDGGFTDPDSGKYDISPNINIKLDEFTSDEDIESIMVVVNRAADQIAAIAFRNPTDEEISNNNKDIHYMLVFEKPKLISDINFKRLILELNRIVDEYGNPFITGHTNFGEFIGISGQFYEGNFKDQVTVNLIKINRLFHKYLVDLNSSKVIKHKVFSYNRSQENSKVKNSNGKHNTVSNIVNQQDGGQLLQDVSNLFKRVFKKLYEEEINYDLFKVEIVKSNRSGIIGFYKSVA